MKVYKGSIITCDEKNTVASYLVEDQGRIIYIGDTLPECYGEAQVTELGRRALLPSFADTHIHFASFSVFHAGLNVMNAGSNQEIMEMLRAHAARSKEKIIMGFGASPYSVSDRKLISRSQLDIACPDRPVFLIKYDGHTCVINTKLLERVKKKISNLRGYHEQTGEMNQEAFFAVSDYVTNSVPVIKLIQSMQRAADYMAGKGIGMIHSVSGVGFPLDLDMDLERWFASGLNNGIQMRVYVQSLDVNKAVKRKLPRIGGCFETALDGCFGSMDAAMLEPYEGTDSRGVLYYPDERIIEFCKKANRLGLQIEVHAIGDEAFRQATTAMKAALDDYPRKDHRHTIIHACLPTDEGLAICRDYHIHLAVQSAFINWLQEPDEYLEQILGTARSQCLNPLRRMQDMGLVLSAGSDASCTDPDPIQWIYKACNHNVPEQSLTVYEALRMCTYNGYCQSFDEKERGSLEIGKAADMVVLSESPYALPVDQLDRLKVEQLLLAGQPYQKLNGGTVKHILRGMRTKSV